MLREEKSSHSVESEEGIYQHGALLRAEKQSFQIARAARLFCDLPFLLRTRNVCAIATKLLV